MTSVVMSAWATHELMYTCSGGFKMQTDSVGSCIVIF